MIVVDDRRRELHLAPVPKRIVSLVPSITETVWHLGAGDRLVGVTRYCTDPLPVRALPHCGGTKNPDCARVLELAPDLVLVSEEENRVEDFERLESAGVPIFVSHPRTVAQVADWVLRLGQLLGCAEAAGAMAAAIRQGLAIARRTSQEVSPRPRVFCPVWKKPWMTFNFDTYVHSVLVSCGGDNLFADAADRYCVVELDEVARRKPDLVLLPDEPYPFGAKDLPAVAPLLQPEGSARAARLVDGQALSWYGARTAAGLERMQHALLGGNP
jgi:ABC-type Fe3+-hydroxamate transport system substrate-binding protein